MKDLLECSDYRYKRKHTVGDYRTKFLSSKKIIIMRNTSTPWKTISHDRERKRKAWLRHTYSIKKI